MALPILILGLVLFLGIHVVPAVPPLRAACASRLGEQRYKGLFSVVSGIGLVLIVAGYAYAPRGDAAAGREGETALGLTRRKAGPPPRVQQGFPAGAACGEHRQGSDG